MVLKKIRVRKQTIKRIKPFTWNGVRYYVDTKGIVYDKYFNIKAQNLSNSGYYFVQQDTKDWGHCQLYVHKIMAYVYLSQSERPYLVVNHKDGNRRNNELANLELVTHSYNIRDGYNRKYMTRLANSRVRKLTPELFEKYKRSDINDTLLSAALHDA